MKKHRPSAEQVDRRTTRRATKVATRFERRAEKAEAHGRTGKADRLRAKGQRKIGKIDQRRQKFGLDPLTGQVTDGSEPVAALDGNGQPVNIFVNNQYGPEGGGYPPNSMMPAQQAPSVTDRTKLDLANQVGNL